MSGTSACGIDGICVRVITSITPFGATNGASEIVSLARAKLRRDQGCARLKNNCRLDSSFNFRKPWLNSDSNEELIFFLDSTHDSSGLMKIWVDSNLTQRLHLQEWVDSTWLKCHNESTQNWLKCKKKLLSGGRWVKKSARRQDSEAKGERGGCKKHYFWQRYIYACNATQKNIDNDKNVYKIQMNHLHIFLCGDKWQFNLWTSYHSFSSRFDPDLLCSLYQDGGSQAHQATFLSVP